MKLQKGWKIIVLILLDKFVAITTEQKQRYEQSGIDRTVVVYFLHVSFSLTLCSENNQQIVLIVSAQLYSVCQLNACTPYIFAANIQCVDSTEIWCAIFFLFLSIRLSLPLSHPLFLYAKNNRNTQYRATTISTSAIMNYTIPKGTLIQIIFILTLHVARLRWRSVN